jgi:hypothetical protein
MCFQIKFSSFYYKLLHAKEWIDARSAFSEFILALQKEIFCLCFQFFI